MNKRLLTGTILGLGAVGAGYAIYKASSKACHSAMEPEIGGFVSPGFDTVRDAFADNFKLRDELGGAVCAYYKGVKVVDLWGGVRNKVTGEPWQEDTMVVVYSTTKGLAAMTLALAHSRGWIDYDEQVAAYWPEFAQNGKENVTVRQLLAHQAGLYCLDEKLDRELLSDPDRLAALLARQKPAWEPGPELHIMPLPSDSLKARFFDAPIQSIEPSASSSRTRSLPRSASNFTSAYRSLYPRHDLRLSSDRNSPRCCLDFRSA